MWFDSNDLIYKKPIILDDLHGYVLPHAGTKYTKNIVNHTLQFKPAKTFKYIKIIYYPSNNNPNVNGKWFHEYYVVWKILEHYVKKFWKLNNIKFIPINLKTGIKKLSRTRKKRQTKTRKAVNNEMTYKNTLTVVSADFSHFLEFQEAIEKENCAAKSILHKNFSPKCTSVIDDEISFKYLYNNIPNNWVLQWIGRTRSPGLKGVGYLSFLIRNEPNPLKDKPDGLFVTVYDIDMRAHECLGLWFNDNVWNKKRENNFVKEVIEKGSLSRLTSGVLNNKKMTNYTITYLYESKISTFKRGWHGVLSSAFYLPDVFLENTFENGVWIKNFHTTWPNFGNFNFKETDSKLIEKSGSNIRENRKFYDAKVLHKQIK